MLSISRSRFSVPAQFVFLAINAIGIVLAVVYNARVPDFYPENAHHKLGWALTLIISAQVFMGIIRTYAWSDDLKYTPVSTEAIAAHQYMDPLRQCETYRFSNDSGQGTEPNTESLRSNSFNSTHAMDLPGIFAEYAEEEGEEKPTLSSDSTLDRYLAVVIPKIFPVRLLRLVSLLHNTIDRVILILGFVAITSGIATYGGFFVGPRKLA